MNEVNQEIVVADVKPAVVKVWLRNNRSHYIIEMSDGREFGIEYTTRQNCLDFCYHVHQDSTGFISIDKIEELVGKDLYDKKYYSVYIDFSKPFISKDTQDFQLWQLVLFMSAVGYYFEYDAKVCRFVSMKEKSANHYISFNNAVTLFNSFETDEYGLSPDGPQWTPFNDDTQLSSDLLPWFHTTPYLAEIACAGRAIQRVKLAYASKQKRLIVIDHNIKFVCEAYVKMWEKDSF